MADIHNQLNMDCTRGKTIPNALDGDKKRKPMRQLSPKLQTWLYNYNQFVKSALANGFKATPITAREGLANLTHGLVTESPKIPWIQEDWVKTPQYSVPVRIYHPAPCTPLPVLIYYHGGGHMAGSVTVYDSICRKMALTSRHIVVAPEYRLAPECPYPAGVQDACNVTRHIWPTLDARKLKYQGLLSIAGDSGGGALAATVAHKTQLDPDIRILRQALIYPSLDYTMNSASMSENGSGYLLEKDKIEWYFDHYFQNRENRMTASPLYMDVTDRFPDTLTITAGFCPLRDEGIAYVEKVKSAGILSKHLHFDDMIHAFMNMENLVKEECKKLYHEIGAFLKQE